MASNSPPHRRSPRLKNYDYAQSGAYFVTICTLHRQALFGGIKDSAMNLNVHGEVVRACWDDLPTHYPNVELDEFIIMPNHVHGIILLTEAVQEGLKPSPTNPIPYGLPEIVRGFKTFSARNINFARNTRGTKVWQRSYHDRLIHNETMLNRIRLYIQTNPAQWDDDEDNPIKRLL
jgi:putative transposase